MDNNKNIDKIIITYLKWLSQVASYEEFSLELQNIKNQKDNNIVISQITDFLLGEIDELKELMTEATEEENLELSKDLLKIKEKINIVFQFISNQEEKAEQQDIILQFIQSKILFATNEYGNIMFDSDLRQIKNKFDEKKSQEFIKLLIDLATVGDNYHFTKQKHLLNNNKLKDIEELKSFQCRIIYEKVKGYYVIIGACVKKDDNGKKYRFFVENCDKQSRNYIDNINEENISYLVKDSVDYFSNKLMKGIENGQNISKKSL